MSEPSVRLRVINEVDVPMLYEWHSDQSSARLAAVPTRTPEDFDRHWADILSNPEVLARIIQLDGAAVGYLVSFIRDRRRWLGYWISREHWGCGLASAGVALFLNIETARPIHAAVAKHNRASRRVLEKAGFRVMEEGIHEVQGERIEELLCVLA